MAQVGEAMEPDELQRFMAKIEITVNCWIWKGGSQSNGYGRFGRDGRRTAYAHRTSYEHFVGPIPSGMTIDHLCRTRLCVRPDHLEAVTNRVNLLRGVSFSAQNAVKIRCSRGHDYTPANTYVDRRGRRDCLRCRQLRRSAPGRREVSA